MREIKFRAKSKYDDGWLYGIPVQDKEGGWLMIEQPSQGYIELSILGEIDSQTIGQYVGLEDKKGREIYEGDIVNAKYVYIEEKPVYDGETGEYIGIKDEEKEIEKTFVVKWHLGAFNLIPDKAIHWEFEIIGNIYENPELLERDNAV